MKLVPHEVKDQAHRHPGDDVVSEIAGVVPVLCAPFAEDASTVLRSVSRALSSIAPRPASLR